MATIARRIKKVKVSVNGSLKVIYLSGGFRLVFKSGLHPAYPAKRDLVRINWSRSGAGEGTPSIEITRRGCSQPIFRDAKLTAGIYSP